MVSRKPWQTRDQLKAEWKRYKFSKKHGPSLATNPWATPFKDAPWLLGMHYIGPSGETRHSDRVDRALDSRGWKARLSNNPRARRAQLAWRYRNSHWYQAPVRQSAVNKFLRKDAERRQHLRFQRGVYDTWREIRSTPP